MRSYKIEDTYAALIIASKGLWNFINYEKVADIVLQVRFFFIDDYSYILLAVTIPKNTNS